MGSLWVIIGVIRGVMTCHYTPLLGVIGRLHLPILAPCLVLRGSILGSRGIPLSGPITGTIMVPNEGTLIRGNDPIMGP